MEKTFVLISRWHAEDDAPTNIVVLEFECSAAEMVSYIDAHYPRASWEVIEHRKVENTGRN